MTLTLCRDCLDLSPTTGGVCAKCGQDRLLSHAELAELDIAHIDCDAFYASVEKRDDPSLADKPLIVGHPGGRGVVTTACYIARRFGPRSAMPMFQALQLCPDAVVIAPNMAKYKEVSRQIRAIFRDATPTIEPVSLDEAYLDLTADERLDTAPAAVALAGIAGRIEREVGITVSVGLSYNKFLAKIASDLDKPRGFSVIGRAEAGEFLSAKPVGLLWGVGAALQRRLAGDGIHRIGELLQYPEAELVQRYGAIGTRLARFSRGEDGRAVKPGRAAKSVSSETTFSEDIRAFDALEAKLWQQCDRVARRMRKSELIGRTATLKLRTANFKILTRSRTLTAPTQLAEVLFHAVLPLLKKEADGRLYRLIGAGLSGLESADKVPQADLFGAEDERSAVLEKTVDGLRDRFGDAAPVKGRSLASKRK